MNAGMSGVGWGRRWAAFMLSLALGAATTFLSALSGLVDDMNGLPAVAVSDGAALQAASYIADVTAPVLRSLSIDMNKTEITLV